MLDHFLLFLSLHLLLATQETNYAFLEGKARTGKDTVEAIDPDKNSITFRKLEAEILREYKTIVYTIQASPKSEGSGSVVHLTLEYEKLHHGIGHPQALLQFLLDVSKDIGAYLTQPSKV
ncbi:hypothetical protein HRI_000170000 [Hibiscus trionum]|nr:hypothetical protein HRI_000170000 [Hibiscus trionum]